MAYFFEENDRDSAFGDDDIFSSTLPECLQSPIHQTLMFTSLSAPLAGTKRDADGAQSTNQGPTAEHIDPKVLKCRACEDARCLTATTESRPSKRRASALKVGEYHIVAGEQSNPNLHTGQQFPDTCFEQFCQGCDLEPSCTSPCALPCPGDTECSEDDACWDPHCDQGLCADDCVDPECTKTTTDDPCFCSNCDAQPCPLGDPNNECHHAHSGPTASGTIYCYDNAPCHFQENYHGFNPNLQGYESYPCYSQAHDVSGHCNSTTQASTMATPVLSPSHYTSLESTFSSHPSPAPKQGSSTQCFLNIPTEHCHIDNLCCHGDSRACGDCPTAPQEYLDLWNASMAQGNGLASSFLNFGLRSTRPMDTLSLPPATTSPTIFDGSLDSTLLGFHDPSWMLSNSHFTGGFDSLAPESSKPEFLTSAVREDELKEEAKASSSTIGDTATVSEDTQTCICRWQHNPGLLCLAVFDGPEALHKHIKTAHVDNCTRCVCQWEGCEASSKDFKQRSKLSRHLLGHAGYRPYKCSFEGCNKTFATNQAKDNHERTHTGDRPYVCDRCGYTTTTHTQLQTHVSALHEGKKPHKCRFCDFSCADSSNLSKHERTHQTLRPYRCPQPNCTFKPDCRWENLKRHLRRSGHCPQLLVEGSEEHKMYRESVRREIDEWHKRNEDGGMTKMTRRKGRG